MATHHPVTDRNARHGANRPIRSREYKFMLCAERFSGGAETLNSATAQWWTACRECADALGIEVRGDLHRHKPLRLIRFHDTAEQLLFEQGYLLRERVKQDSGEREVTLKFRHPDRYVAQDRDMTAASGDKSKFEQDIKPLFAEGKRAFHSLYSYSASQTVASGKKLDRLGDAVALYPTLAQAVAGDAHHADALQRMGRCTTAERVIDGASFRFAGDPSIEAECALILWYRYADEHHAIADAEQPVVAEFSFRYGSKKERFCGGVARQAYDLFLALTGLKRWVPSQQVTKTEFTFG